MRDLILALTGIAMLLLPVACQQEPATQLQTTSYNNTVYVYLAASNGEQFATKVYLAAAGQSGLKICLESEVSRCGINADNIYFSKAVGTKGETSFFKLNRSLPIRPGDRYFVLNQTNQNIDQFTFRDPNEPEDPIAAGLAQIQKDTIEQELKTLASDNMNGRLSGTADNERAAQWIIDQLQQVNVPPARTAGYKQEFRLTRGPTADLNTANIIAKLEGSDPNLKDEYIIIGAHMDHAGTLSRGYTCSRGAAGSNPICNGADDNASGSIAVLNAAKALAKVRSQLKRSVLFIWFSGEEEGLLGSAHYVNRDPVVPIAKTAYMINLDMVGYMKSFGNRLGALGGETNRQAAELMREIAKRFPERSISLTRKAGGGSDHVHFMNAGIPGVFFHTGVQNNRNYHRTSDTPDKVDYDGLTMATKVTFELVFRIANDPSTSDYLGVDVEREPLVTPEELKQTCHHLMKNPFVEQLTLDFTDSNFPQQPE